MHRGSGLWDTFSSRDENSSSGADNICFILKVAKESSSWANIVPVQYFMMSFSRGVQTAGIKARQMNPLLSLCRYQRITLLPGMTNTPPGLAQNWMDPLLTLFITHLLPAPSVPTCQLPIFAKLQLIRKKQTGNVPLAQEKIALQRQGRAEK